MALNLAVAGAGAMGQRHIDFIARSDECRLSAIVDPSPAAKAMAAKANVPLMSTLDDLFTKARPDGVILATPNQLHAEQALACIAARVPVLVEKPIADTIDAAERVVRAAEASGAAVLTGHHRQHNPLMTKAVEIVRGGRLGRIVAAVGTAMFCKPDSYYEEGPWRRKVGGGPILINLIHEIGNLRALCGEISAVQAIASNAIRAFAVEDTVAINLQFESGALGTFMLSDTAASARSWELTAQEDQNYPANTDEDCYVVVGTRGSLAIPTMRVKTYLNESSWWQPFAAEVVAVPRVDPWKRQLVNFCAAICGDAKPVVTARDGLQNLRVIDAIKRAARIGGRVAIA
ncbi:MAG: Gfo/Idh/MocA family oxidoreductase [Pseudolabrys sp.]|nr:Gfo/Idh/MocA family oxidoreductase [Pseudolabrys sp.]